ncbi:MAG: hypothetical protein ACXWWA_05675 [Chitinophagaceae bacterium]
MTSPDTFSGERFTDRGRGKWFVLSAYRAASRTAEGKQVIPHGINATGDGCMECHLLRMCQNITHLYKQIVN